MLRHAVRSLVARPAYALVAGLTIALVVGAGSAVVAVINATVVRPLPFADGDRLVQIYTLPPGLHAVADRNPFAAIDFVRMRDRTGPLDGLAGLWARERAIDGATEPESIKAASVSANLFQVLGAAPMLGRSFTETEDRTDARVVVLGYGLWQRRFGGREDAVGKRLSIDREDYEVIGVMPASFNAAFVVSEMWTPLSVREDNLILPGATFVQTVGRLRRGATMAELNRAVSAAMADISKEVAQRSGWTTDSATLRDAQFGSTRPTLMLLGAAILALALIACANLTNLTVAEVANRRGEFVLRTALGARRCDLIRAQAVESALLAIGGLAAGLGVAALTLPAVLALDPATATRLGVVTIDWRVQAASGALALAVSLVAGVLPALWATRGDMARGLAAGAVRLTGGRRQRRVRFALVATETLLSVVLLTSGALLVSAFGQSARTNPGFDPHQVLGAQLRLSAVAYPTLDSRAAFVRTMLEHVRSSPGVVEASTTGNLFVPGFAFVTLIKIEGKPSPDGQAYTVQFRRISPGYFRTMRIPEVAGRTFDERDISKGLPVAIVSRSLADRYWPGEDAIGRRVLRSGAALTVIGVVGDVSDVGFGQAPAPTLYLPYAQSNVAPAPVSLVVRTNGDPDGAVRTIARAIHDVDSTQPLSSVTTLERFLSDSLGPERFRSVLLTVFACLGLALAAVGIYGVTSRGVAERSREMGVRLALGCEPSRIWRLVLRQSLAAVVAGFAVGLPVAAAAVAFLRHSLPGVSSASAVDALPALAVLATAAFIAAALPARRATRVDPLRALRQS